MIGWQPFETAPKDGRHILAAGVNDRIEYVDLIFFVDSEEGWWELGNAWHPTSEKTPHLQVSYHRHNRRDGSIYSHWMPVLRPPCFVSEPLWEWAWSSPAQLATLAEERALDFGTETK